MKGNKMAKYHYWKKQAEYWKKKNERFGIIIILLVLVSSYFIIGLVGRSYIRQSRDIVRLEESQVRNIAKVEVGFALALAGLNKKVGQLSDRSYKLERLVSLLERGKPSFNVNDAKRVVFIIEQHKEGQSVGEIVIMTGNQPASLEIVEQ